MKQEIKERIEKIRKGEVPERYKKTKVGIIPDEWDVGKLGDLGDFKKGKGVSGKDIKKTGLPAIMYGDIYIKYNTHFEKADFKIDKETAIKSTSINKGDLLFTCSGETAKEIGKCVSYQGDDEIYIGGDIIALTLNGGNSLFLAYQQNAYNQIKQKAKFGQGYSVVHIYEKQIRALNIPLPKIKEQKKIAEILSIWDKAIELKEKLIEDRKKQRIAIVNDLLFGLKRFGDLIKSHKCKQTRYTNIPKDWEFIKIGDVATEVSEKNGNHDDLPVLSCTKHAGLVDSLSYFKRQVFSENTSTYKQVKKNHFVYATNHIDEGSIGYQNLFGNSLVSPMYTVFKTNSKVNNHFLFSLLKTRLYIFIYQVNMSASVDRRGSLRWNDFSKIRIPLPDIAEQNKIVEFIRSVDSNIELLNKELNQLKEQKRGLMQLLLTGTVRVEVN